MAKPPRVLAIVMAGGRGDRLKPLTQIRSKPAVPFGGRYRIIDFVLSNLVNSQIDSIYVLTQYKAQSLLKHILRAWSPRAQGSAFVEAVPAQMQSGEAWYQGTADAVHQNINLVQEFAPDYVAVFGADHVYKMDISQMLDFHIDSKSVATVACLPVPLAEAGRFGVVQVDEKARIRGFLEKPREGVPAIPGRPEMAFASMGNYIFSTEPLLGILRDDARRDGAHDFGLSIFPRIIAEFPVHAYDFLSNRIPTMNGGFEAPYWRDVGTIESYFEATMDLKSVLPSLNLYNWVWPIHTASFDDPPAKFVFDEERRRGTALDSLVSSGCIISGSRVKDSVLGRNVFIHTGARVEDSIIFDNVDIGRHCQIRRAIIDKNVRVPPNTIIDGEQTNVSPPHFRSSSGITVLAKAPEDIWTKRRNW